MKLRRGSDLYRWGCVKITGCVQNEQGVETVRATVTNMFVYDITVQFINGYVLSAMCGCQWGDNTHCEHTAAVCFAYKDLKEQEEKKRQQLLKAAKRELEKQQERDKQPVYPFPAPPAGVYRYFRLDRAVAGMTFYDVDLAKTEKLEKHINIKHSFDNCEWREPILEVGGNGAGLKVSAEKITHVSCWGYNDCNCKKTGFIDKDKKRPCPNVLSLLLAVRDYQNEDDNADATNYTAACLLDNFVRNGMDIGAEGENTEEKHACIRLVPRVFHDADNITKIGFKIGKDKLFVVKKLHELLDCVDRSGILEAGKNCVLDFSKETFDENSRPFFDMIRTEEKETERIRNRLSNYYYHPGGLVSLTEFTLSGSNIDVLYDYLKNRGEADYQDRWLGGKGMSLKAGMHESDLSMELIGQNNADDEFESLRLKGVLPTVLRGASACYGITKDEKTARMYELPEKTVRCVERLERAGLSGKIDLAVGRNNLNMFCRNILPLMRDCFDISEPDMDVIDPFLPPEPEFAYYLDLDHEGIPTCHIKVTYGQNTYNALQQSKGEGNERDSIRERRAADCAAVYLPYINNSREYLMMNDRNEDELFRLLEKGIPEMSKIGDIYMTKAFRNVEIRNAPKVNVGVSVSRSGDLLNLNITSDDISTEELLELFNSYNLRKKYHRMKDGSFVRIDESIETLAKMTDALQLGEKDLIRGNMHIPSFRAMYIESMLEKNENVSTDRDASFRRLIRNFKSVNESEYEVPDTLRGVLRKYQEYGYRWMRTLTACGFGGILADDMGLGKTLQVITVLLAAVQEGEKHPSIVICPASLMYNWQDEITRFAPELSVSVISGTKKERAALIEKADESNVLITSYDLLKRDIDVYEPIAFAYQILDEAQYIKTHVTAAAKSVKIVNAAHRFALTGTPIENRLSELWSIFDYLMPGFLYNYNHFKSDMETPIVKKMDKEASDRLKRMVSPFILRRLKGDVLKDLPEKLEETRFAHMESDQRRVYDAQVLKISNMLNKTDDAALNKNKLAVLSELMRIRQICCDPSLLFEDYNAGSAKRELCMDLIESAIEGGHRMLIFSQFTSMLAFLEKDLNDRGIAYYKITGDTPKAERLDLVKRFNSNDVPVFLISLKAGGTGLNLIGADVVIHYDPWWNIAAQNQATDRAHRIGQTKKVMVYRLIAKDTIEEKIMKLQNTKQALADEILSGENVSLSSLTRDDLMELIG